MKRILVCIAFVATVLSCKKDCPPNEEPAQPSLYVALASSNLPGQRVNVSSTSITRDIELLKFTLKATGGDLHFEEFPIGFQTGGSISTLERMTEKVTLIIDGEEYSETVATGNAGATIVFDDIDLDLQEGDIVTCTVYADINPIGTGFAEGSWLMAYVATEFAPLIDVEDVHGDPIPHANKFGAAWGEMMEFRTDAVEVIMGIPTITRTTNTNGDITQVQYSIPVRVTSSGPTLYLGQTVQLASGVSGTNAFASVFQIATAPTVDDTTGVASVALTSSNAAIEGNGFRLDGGQTKHFTITVTLVDPSVPNSSYRVRIKQMQTFTNALLTTGRSVYNLSPVEDYRTDYQFINN